jgi:hypothetical protein
LEPNHQLGKYQNPYNIGRLRIVLNYMAMGRSEKAGQPVYLYATLCHGEKAMRKDGH